MKTAPVRQVGSLLAALCALAVAPAAGQPPPGRLSNDGVARAASQVDSVFVARTKADGRVEGGDWASYLLARLGTGRIPDSLGILVGIDSTHIEVSGRLQDLPPEARVLLGPLTRMVDSATVVTAEVVMERTGREVERFWLRGLRVNGFLLPEFILGSMMASVGRQYPALTASGRDLYVQSPPDGRLTLGDGALLIAVPPPAADTTGRQPPPGTP
jgi:hypothetical protein